MGSVCFLETRRNARKVCTVKVERPVLTEMDFAKAAAIVLPGQWCQQEPVTVLQVTFAHRDLRLHKAT